MLSSILYAETTAEIDIQELVDYIKDLEAKVDRLERQFEDLDAAMGAIDNDAQEGKDNVTTDMVADIVKEILREDVTISVEIDC
tara:strand:- start:237 stop:488 length:252 start_codon:yes stop_codon:yes gene_type:complete